MELLNSILQNQVKSIPVTIIEKDRLASVAAEDDVVDGIREMDTEFASHAMMLTEECPKVKPDPRS